MTPPPDSPTFTTIMRVRLIALIGVKGYTLSALSSKMGRTLGHLGRKLDPPETGEARALLSSDIDDVLKALDVSPAVLSDHVVGGIDHALLGWVIACPTPPLQADAGRFIRNSERPLRRLLSQGLLVTVPGASQPCLSITDEGRRMYALPPLL